MLHSCLIVKLGQNTHDLSHNPCSCKSAPEVLHLYLCSSVSDSQNPGYRHILVHNAHGPYV